MPPSTISEKRKRNCENRQVYVGNLPFDATEEELHRVFSIMGSLKSIWMAKRPPGFAFITFKRTINAYDAVKYLNGTKICDLKATVEMCEWIEIEENDRLPSGIERFEEIRTNRRTMKRHEEAESEEKMEAI